MQTTLTIEEQIIEKLKALPPERQQQVLDFVEFLLSKFLKQKSNNQEATPISFIAATRKFVGCLDGGPSDLSSNKKYLKELGRNEK